MSTLKVDSIEPYSADVVTLNGGVFRAGSGAPSDDDGDDNLYDARDDGDGLE